MKLHLAALSFVSLLLPARAQGVLLFQDDFNDDQLDASKWTTVETGTPGAAVVEQHQQIEITNAGYLVTVPQFDPAALSGIRVTARVQYAQWVSDYEVFSITTRSDGVPTGPYGMPQNGLRFAYGTNVSAPGIEAFGSVSIGPVSTTGSISVALGDEVEFDVRDLGDEISITLTKVGDPQETATATATVLGDTTTVKHISCFNRPGNKGAQISYIDDVEVYGHVEVAQPYCTAKTNSQGCVPEVGFSGIPSTSGPDNFFVTASNVLNNKTGLLLWSHGQASTPFFGGTLCVAQPITRTSAQNSGGNPSGTDCSGTYSFHFAQSYMVGQLLGGGSTVYAQYWSRDPGFAAPNSIGLTDALRFTIIP
jgi:hypothetical protein